MTKYKKVKCGKQTDQGYEKVIWDDGEIWYNFDGKHHKIGGPAVIWENGAEFWYIHGERHREDGAAVIWHDGNKEYWLNGSKITRKIYHKFTPLQLAKLGLI